MQFLEKYVHTLNNNELCPPCLLFLLKSGNKVYFNIYFIVIIKIFKPEIFLVWKRILQKYFFGKALHFYQVRIIILMENYAVACRVTGRVPGRDYLTLGGCAVRTFVWILEGYYSIIIRGRAHHPWPPHTPWPIISHGPHTREAQANVTMWRKIHHKLGWAAVLQSVALSNVHLND